MLTQRQLFLAHQAQTSDAPVSLEIEKAEGIYLFDTSGKKYIDLISGISVSNLGHRHPQVITAIKAQLDKYMHLMVYGEFIQSPQVELAKLLADVLPENLNYTYFVNSGSEAVEGAMKLAKRFTGRTEIIALKNAYHGSTQGALSVAGHEDLKNSFRPLIPDIRFLEFNNVEDLQFISNKTAALIVEPVQGEAGVMLPKNDYLLRLREKCRETGTLLIFDEIQTGFGRTGTLFAFEQYKAIPDILLLAKGMGGGMPLGAFISSKEIMSSLTFNPVLGHISTFGGHPVSCTASLETLRILLREDYIQQIPLKEKLFLKLLKHPSIKNIRSKGLMFALEFESFDFNKKVIDDCISNGVMTDWFLFCDKAMRIAPPLIITEKEIQESCEIILRSIDKQI